MQTYDYISPAFHETLAKQGITCTFGQGTDCVRTYWWSFQRGDTYIASIALLDDEPRYRVDANDGNLELALAGAREFTLDGAFTRVFSVVRGGFLIQEKLASIGLRPSHYVLSVERTVHETGFDGGLGSRLYRRVVAELGDNILDPYRYRVGLPVGGPRISHQYETTDRNGYPYRVDIITRLDGFQQVTVLALSVDGLASPIDHFHRKTTVQLR